MSLLLSSPSLLVAAWKHVILQMFCCLLSTLFFCGCPNHCLSFHYKPHYWNDIFYRSFHLHVNIYLRELFWSDVVWLKVPFKSNFDKYCEVALGRGCTHSHMQMSVSTAWPNNAINLLHICSSARWRIVFWWSFNFHHSFSILQCA